MNLVPHFITACAVALTVTACTKGTYQAPDAPVKEVAFTQVHIDDKFWAPRIETNRLVSIPSAFKECEKNGRFDNFAIAGGLMKGEHRGDFSFDDTDPYKIIEGASYSLAVQYDPQLDAYLDSVITLIAAAGNPTVISPRALPISVRAFRDGGELTAGRRSTAMNSTTADTSMRRP